MNTEATEKTTMDEEATHDDAPLLICNDLQTLQGYIIAMVGKENLPQPILSGVINGERLYFWMPIIWEKPIDKNPLSDQMNSTDPSIHLVH